MLGYIRWEMKKMTDEKPKRKDFQDSGRQKISRQEIEMLSWMEDFQDRYDSFLLDVIDIVSSGREIHGQKIA